MPAMTARPPTLVERLNMILQLTKKDAAELERVAGLGKNHIGAMKARKSKQIHADTAYRLAWAARLSHTWVSTGLGSPDAPDVPVISPMGLDVVPLENHPDWTTVALRAIEKEQGRLDWAVMGVGEEPIDSASPELSEYFVLHEAEKMAKKLANDSPERERLDAKLRDFLAKNTGSRRVRQPPSGKHEAKVARRNRKG